MKAIPLLAAAFLVLSGAGVTLHEARSNPAPALSIPFITADECTTDCWEGEAFCPQEDTHLAHDQGPAGNHRSGTPHERGVCAAGTCESQHPLDCGPELNLASLESLRRALIDENATVTRALLKKAPRNIELNVQRQAIQIISCKGLVVAHLPITAEFVSRLGAAD